MLLLFPCAAIVSLEPVCHGQDIPDKTHRPGNCGRFTGDQVRTRWHIPFIYLFFVRLGFELRVLCLQSRWSTAWTTLPAHFSLVIFGDGGLKNYLSGLALTLIFLISASQVAGIIGVSHQCPAWHIPCSLTRCKFTQAITQICISRGHNVIFGFKSS
jgi:hypothetical protein